MCHQYIQLEWNKETNSNRHTHFPCHLLFNWFCFRKNWSRMQSIISLFFGLCRLLRKQEIRNRKRRKRLQIVLLVLHTKMALFSNYRFLKLQKLQKNYDSIVLLLSHSYNLSHNTRVYRHTFYFIGGKWNSSSHLCFFFPHLRLISFLFDILLLHSYFDLISFVCLEKWIHRDVFKI